MSEVRHSFLKTTISHDEIINNSQSKIRFIEKCIDINRQDTAKVRYHQMITYGFSDMSFSKL